MWATIMQSRTRYIHVCLLRCNYKAFLCIWCYYLCMHSYNKTHKAALAILQLSTHPGGATHINTQSNIRSPCTSIHVYTCTCINTQLTTHNSTLCYIQYLTSIYNRKTHFRQCWLLMAMSHMPFSSMRTWSGLTLIQIMSLQERNYHRYFWHA